MEPNKKKKKKKKKKKNEELQFLKVFTLNINLHCRFSRSSRSIAITKMRRDKV